jgi:hypothetical protein
VQVVDPLVDGSGERGEHARIIGRRRLAAVGATRVAERATQHSPCVPW